MQIHPSLGSLSQTIQYIRRPTKTPNTFDNPKTTLRGQCRLRAVKNAAGPAAHPQRAGPPAQPDSHRPQARTCGLPGPAP